MPNGKLFYETIDKPEKIVYNKLKSETDWKSVVKCYIPNDMYNSQHELFSVDMPELGQDTLIIEVILPNGDRGGFRNYLYVRK